MDLSRLYELIERFHRSNQLPAFLIGAVAALVGGFLVLKYSRLRILSDAGRDAEIKGLLKDVNRLTAEKEQWRNELNHVEKHSEALKTRLLELIGRQQAQTEALRDLTAECEQLKGKLRKYDQQRRYLFDRLQKLKRVAGTLKAIFERIKAGNGRIWEATPDRGAAPFKPLSQRRTTILSLVNLKGGVGKTTITANLAVAMSKLGWRGARGGSRSSELAFSTLAHPGRDGRTGRLTTIGSPGARGRDRPSRQFSPGNRTSEQGSRFRDLDRGGR